MFWFKKKPKVEEINNKAFEALLIKAYKYEISDEEFINKLNEIKDKITITRMFKLDENSVVNGVLKEGSTLAEVMWSPDNNKPFRPCYTSYEKASLNRPPFQTVVLKDSFMNIVKNCVSDNIDIIVNPGDKFAMALPMEILNLISQK